MTGFFTRRTYIAFFVLFFVGIIFYASYFQENTEAYLFPGIVAGSMLALCLLSLVREVFDLCMDDFESFPFVSQVFSLIVMITTVLLLEAVGMYACCFAALMLISIWYSPQQDTKKKYINSFLFSTGFIAGIYLLFSMLLNVQLPKGLLI